MQSLTEQITDNGADKQGVNAVMKMYQMAR